MFWICSKVRESMFIRTRRKLKQKKIGIGFCDTCCWCVFSVKIDVIENICYCISCLLHWEKSVRWKNFNLFHFHVSFLCCFFFSNFINELEGLEKVQFVTDKNKNLKAVFIKDVSYHTFKILFWQSNTHILYWLCVLL